MIILRHQHICPFIDNKLISEGLAVSFSFNISLETYALAQLSMSFVHPRFPSAGIIVAIGAAAATIHFLHLGRLFSLSLKYISTKICPSAGRNTVDNSGSSLLVLCSKSPEDNEFAQSLKSKWKTLNLLDEKGNGKVRVLLFSEMDSAMTFQSQLYMKALSTSNFGKLLIWSPRLSSTHDLVTQ